MGRKLKIKIVFIGLLLTSACSSGGLGQIETGNTPETPQTPAIPNVPDSRRILFPSSFESFTAKSASEHYQLFSSSNKLFTQGKMTSEKYQAENPIFDLAGEK